MVVFDRAFACLKEDTFAVEYFGIASSSSIAVVLLPACFRIAAAC